MGEAEAKITERKARGKIGEGCMEASDVTSREELGRGAAEER